MNHPSMKRCLNRAAWQHESSYASYTATHQYLTGGRYRLIRQTLRSMLEPLPTVTLAGEAADGESAVKMALDLQPDIVVMDIQMPKLDGIEATRRIMQALPRTSIIGFSVQTDATIHRAMHEAGAITFLGKERVTELPQIIHTLAGRRQLGDE